MLTPAKCQQVITNKLAEGIIRWCNCICNLHKTSQFTNLLILKLHNLGVDEDSELWIGAWWIGFIIVGAFLLFISPFMMLFPAVIPMATKNQNTHSDTTNLQNNFETEDIPTNFRQWLSEIINLIKRLVKNRIFVLYLLSLSCVVTTFHGLVVFLPKYYEFVFRQRASTSTGGPAAKVVTSVLGLLLAGFAMGRFQPRPRK